MKNLDKEYVSVKSYYDQQKEYRSTSKGKLALRRAKEKQLLKKMTMFNCQECGINEFEILTIVGKITLCYNCKFRRSKVLEDYELCL
jgi:hypothetical protein